VSSALVRVLPPRGDAVYNTRNVNQDVQVENESRLTEPQAAFAVVNQGAYFLLPRRSADSPRFSVGQELIAFFADRRAVSDVGIVVHLIIREISQAVITHRLLKDLRLKFLEQFFHWIGHYLFLSLASAID
jgi:hypothetical protein